MSRHVVIGTAGHVDHGKSALVLALTGTDPDRWAEEKRRGITIDLGFARLPLADGIDASVVDVPGHEDFVRNMVAGATGVDVALLVVAADEGVMPQTVEHLAILDLLGVQVGVVALTKADLVEADWLALVTDDIRTRLDAHAMRWEAIVPVSATQGTGLDTLRARLVAAATGAPERPADDLFRLPVDRVFSVAGAGTVVTGTVWSGAVAVGGTVRFLPSGAEARVRSIEVHGRPADRALPGRRTALAVAGVDRAALRRGEVAVTDLGWRATSLLDVEARLLSGARPFTQRTRLRVHLGTTEVLARVTPGEGGGVRLRLEEPLVARWGDLGVLRSYSPVTTVGGFRVLDPWPAARPRRPHGAEALGGAGRLAVAVGRAGPAGIARADLPVRFGVAADVALPPGVVEHDGRLVEARLLDDAVRVLATQLAAHHRARPELPGLAREAVRQALGPLAEAAIRRALAEGTIAEAGPDLHLVGHVAVLAGSDAADAEALMTELDRAGYEGRDAGEVDQRLAEFLVRAGRVRRLGRTRYYLPAHLEAMVTAAVELLDAGDVPPAAFRERLGLSRKYLIPFLEWLDQEGYSVRAGDVRRRGRRAT